MDFRILGPLEVLDDGRTLDLGGAKQRAALAVLALHANRVVTHERLIEALWDEEPPETARKALQVYVSQLRKVLGRDRLETKPRGYLLRLGPEELDLSRFELLRDGGKPEQALEQWRGDPLADFADRRFAEPEIARLEELRLSCLEQRIERDLAAGRHGELVGELDGLARAYPLREHLRAQLMLALYRSGGQAEALEVYQSARVALVDGLGIEPGTELRELHQQVLMQDQALDLPAAKRPERAKPATAAPHPETPAAMAESRKTVTVLFCDLADSTELGERLDPESLRGLMARWYDAMREPLARHGGTVEKFIGDAVMAVFGVPHVHEDDALRAVRAAVEMREALARLNEELAGERRPELRIRIGVNSGEVVTGDHATTLVTGDAVNTAKRLEEAAAPDEILIGDQTRRLVENAAVLEPSAPVEAKGKRKPVEAWRVLGTIEGAAPFARRTDTPIVNRLVERARLLAAYEESVADRSCRVVTVLGAAGIGKSKLAADLLSAAAGRATVLVGRCLPYGEGITFWPVVELVRAAGGADAVEAALTGDDDRPAAALRELLEPGAESVSSSDEIFWATRRLLETLAAEQPVIVCIEDIHWAEPTLLDMLEYLSGFIRHAPVLLLCLARPELAERRPSWLTGGVVVLEPLSERDSETLLDGLGDFDPEARRRIREAAEGNPLFAEQLAALALDGGPTVLPPTIQALLAERLDRLEPTERIVLEHASVVGREFSRDHVVALAPAELHRAVGAHLLSLTRKGLIRPDEAVAARDGFRFHHILIRDAAYDGMPKAARAALHERLADLLERAERHSELEEIVGYHLEQAYRLQGDLGVVDAELGVRAGERLATAGRRALARGDARAAVNLLGRAAALFPDGDLRRLSLLPEYASALIRAGELTRADDVLAEAAERAEAAGDERIRLRVLVEREFIRSSTHPEAGSEGLVRVANEAIAGLEPLGDDAGLSKAWWLLGEVHSIAGHWQKRADALERALDHARRGGSSEVTGLVALLAQALYYGPTPADEALVRCREFLAEAVGDRSLEAALQGTLGGLHAMRGDFDEARGLHARAVTTYEEMGHHFRRASRSLVGGEIEMLAGDAAAAEQELAHGCEILERMGERGLRSTLTAFLARALAAQELFDEAEERTRYCEQTAGADDLVTQVVWRSTRAVVLAHRGEHAPAGSLAEEATALSADTDFLDLRASALAGLAEVLVLAGRDDDAAVAAESATAIYERKGNVVAARNAALLVPARKG
jgi:class 3 adenylate cyclase/tetratricopeptide (TPR) repeat protein